MKYLKSVKVGVKVNGWVIKALNVDKVWLYNDNMDEWWRIPNKELSYYNEYICLKAIRNYVENDGGNYGKM